MDEESNRGTYIHGNVEKLTQIGKVEGNVVVQQGQDAEKLIKSGIQLVRIGAYEQASSILAEAIKSAPLEADAYYYLALGMLDGKRPKISTLARVKVIEQKLQTACELSNNRAHYYYLWALVKFDFYFVNGFMVRPPKIEELLLAGRQSVHEPSLILEMLKHTGEADNQIVAIIAGGL